MFNWRIPRLISGEKRLLAKNDITSDGLTRGVFGHSTQTLFKLVNWGCKSLSTIPFQSKWAAQLAWTPLMSRVISSNNGEETWSKIDGMNNWFKLAKALDSEIAWKRIERRLVQLVILMIVKASDRTEIQSLRCNRKTNWSRMLTYKDEACVANYFYLLNWGSHRCKSCLNGWIVIQHHKKALNCAYTWYMVKKPPHQWSRGWMTEVDEMYSERRSLSMPCNRLRRIGVVQQVVVPYETIKRQGFKQRKCADNPHCCIPSAHDDPIQL